MQISLIILYLYSKNNTKSLLRHTFFNMWGIQNTHPSAETLKIAHYEKLVILARRTFESRFFTINRIRLYWKIDTNFTQCAHFVYENQLQTLLIRSFYIGKPTQSPYLDTRFLTFGAFKILILGQKHQKIADFEKLVILGRKTFESRFFQQKIESDYIRRSMQIYSDTHFFSIWDLQNTHLRAETSKNLTFRKIFILVGFPI